MKNILKCILAIIPVLLFSSCFWLNKGSVQRQVQKILDTRYSDLKLKVVAAYTQANEASMESWSRYSVVALDPQENKIIISWNNKTKTLSDNNLRERYKAIIQENQLSTSLQSLLDKTGKNLTWISLNKSTDDNVRTGGKIRSFFFLNLNGHNKQQIIGSLKAEYINWLTINNLPKADITLSFISSDMQKTCNDRDFINRKRSQHPEDNSLYKYVDYNITWRVDSLQYKLSQLTIQPDYLKVMNQHQLAEKIGAFKALKDYARQNTNFKNAGIVEPRLYLNQTSLDDYFIVSGLYGKGLEGNNGILIYGTYSISNQSFQFRHTTRAEAGVRHGEELVPVEYQNEKVWMKKK